MGQTFGTASVIAQYFVGLLAAGPLHGNFLQLLFELFLGQFAALEAIAGLHDLFDVELEDVAPAKFAFGALAPAQENAQPAPALLERELDFLSDLVVIGDGFLGLAGKRHPDRSHVNENDHRSRRERASGLSHAVVAPAG